MISTSTPIDRTDSCAAPRGRLQLVLDRWLAGASTFAIAGSAVVAVGVAVMSHEVATAPEVHAVGFEIGPDTDLDGLSDVFEDVLSTNAAAIDSDGDGFTDLEEIARQSDPRNELSIPVTSGKSIGQAAFVEGAQMRVLTLVYVPWAAVDWSKFDLHMGLQTPVGTIELGPEVYAPLSTLKFYPGSKPGSLVARLESTVPASIFEGIGSFALYATLAELPSTKPAYAAATNFVEVAGVFAAIERTDAAVLAPRALTPSSGSGPMLSIWPLVPPEDVPSAFIVGQICIQTTTEVGYVGATLEVLVDSSDCKSADSYCSPTCPFEIGTTKQIVDALALIGG
ncbi:MAG: thrombospondin type 3 repeat-containing protein [Planctomycetota bacterium]